MENLKELEKSIMKKYSDKFVFFRVSVPIKYVANRSVFWDGKDYDEFFDMASTLDVKVIYYHEAFPQDTKEKYAKHADDIAELEFGFMMYYDWMLHAMSLRADWYNPNDDFYNPNTPNDDALEEES